MLLLLVNLVHQLLQSVLGLQSLLLGFARLVSLLLPDDLLLLVGVSQVVRGDVEGNDVLLDAVDHVVVRALEHQLEIMLVLDHCQLVLC